MSVLRVIHYDIDKKFYKMIGINKKTTFWYDLKVFIKQQKTKLF